MTYDLPLDKNQLSYALGLAASQQARAATKFTKGSAAYNELTKMAADYKAAQLEVDRLPTPLEAAIEKKK